MTTKKSPTMIAVAAVLTVSTFSQSLGLSMISTASAAESTQSGQAVSAISVIQGAMNQLDSELGSGKIAKEDAVARFADTLVQNEVTMNDMDNFALVTYSPEQYSKIHNDLEIAMKGTSGLSALNRESTEAMASVFSASKSNGLSIAGCGALVGGIALAVGALVVGIIALVNTKGAGRIKSDYDNQKASLTSDYNTKVAYYKDWKTSLNGEIAAHQALITRDQNKISYYSGVIAGSNDPQTIKDANYYLQQYNQDITAQNAAIAQLNLKIAEFTNNPQAVTDIINQYTTDYNAQMANLQTQEDSAIANVPANKKRAGTLGIVAGVSAALAAVLLVGNDGSCD